MGESILTTRAIPSVSVLIPTFDRPAMLQEAAASVFAQTHADVELLVGIDGNRPGPWQAVRELSEHPNLRAFGYSRRGPFGVYEELFKNAQGDFIVLFSDDDILLPRFVERCLDAIEGADMVRTAWYLWDGKDGRRIDPVGWGAFNSSMYRTSLLQEFIARYGSLFDPGLGFYGDSSFYRRIMDFVPPERRIQLDEPLILYREHPGQLSKNPPIHAVLEYVRSRNLQGQPLRVRELPPYIGWTLKRRIQHWAAGKRV